MTPDEILRYLIPIGTTVFSLGAFYGLIRADIRYITERLTRIDRDISFVQSSAEKAHERIDSHVLAYHKGN